MSLPAATDDLVQIERLRLGDEAAFVEIVETLGPVMLRVARMHVSSPSTAQEVVQEAWLGMLESLDRFEARSSLRTWILRIVTNIAKTRGVREKRSVPFTALTGPDDESLWDPLNSVASGQLTGGYWSSMPRDWSGIPEDRLIAEETLGLVRDAIESLSPMQAAVIQLHDVLGWSAEEVRNALELSETNQRVLLHRARAKVRRVLDDYLASGSHG